MDKKKALETTLANIEKQYGKNAVMRLGERSEMVVSAIPTGSLTLDLALGIGGIPKGRIIEIYGPEASGKTTLSLHIIAQAQKAGGEVAFIDAEHALDPEYAAALGVDIDNLLISQPDTGEQGLEITEALVRSGVVEVVVIDSVAALVPKSEIEGAMGDSFVGLHARLMSQALRKLAGFISKSNCAVIFINQLREKIGITYGSNEVTTGGKALKFYASVRIDIRRSEWIKSGTQNIGTRTRAKVTKNKMAPPFKEGEFDIMFGEGISREGELIDLGVLCGQVVKSGSWFSIDEERIGQGRDNAKTYLSGNPELMESLEKRIRQAVAEDPSLLSKVKSKKPAKTAAVSKITSSATPVAVTAEDFDNDDKDDDEEK
ncbi:MAG: recombinase RecA [Oscillospiraceae bacterium]|jgi:recombination protein RecA|nr:recombinase RecA [Oscillospiraceae bacterium]